jgi:leukotriene-A4 hydrolase
LLVQVESTVKSSPHESVHPILRKIDAAHQFSSSKNAEIRFLWYSCCLKAHDSSVFPHVVDFVTTQGRMKFVRPLYRELSKVSEEGRQLARSTFTQHRSFYHSIASKMVAKDLGL